MAEELEKTERAPTQMRRSNIPPDTILVGKKPIMAYATAVMMHFNTGAKKLTIKARGRAISTAVDVAEVVNNRFFQGGLTKQVSLGTEVVGEAQDARNVSTIEISLERTK
jgi:DNA-binding protein